MRHAPVYLAALLALYSLGATFMLTKVSDEIKHRQSVEQTQMACLDAKGGLTVQDDFKECVLITWRHADEDGVK